MRKLLLLFIAVLATSCGSSKFYPAEAPTHVQILTDMNKEDNYIVANEWMVETFNNAESVIQFTDKEEGIVKGKYHITSLSNQMSGGFYVPGTMVNIGAIITIRVKDSAAKISIDGSGNKYRTDYGIGYTPAEFKVQEDLLISDFKNRMAKGKDSF